MTDQLQRDAVKPNTKSSDEVTWNCAFCGKLRVFEGGRPFSLSHLDTCGICGTRVAVPLDNHVSLRSSIANHLI